MTVTQAKVAPAARSAPTDAPQISAHTALPGSAPSPSPLWRVVALPGNCVATLQRASLLRSHFSFCSEGARTSLRGSEARARRCKFRQVPRPAARRCAEEGGGRECDVQTRRLGIPLDEGRTQKIRFQALCVDHSLLVFTAGIFPRVRPFSLPVHSMYPE